MNIISKLREKIRYRGAQLSMIERQLNNFRYNSRCAILEDKILHSLEPGISTCEYCTHEIIVSLTTYGKRLQEVCYTVESLMQQTMLANRIVLNVDPSSQTQPLPLSLQKQIDRGLEVAVVEDIKSYKKLIPTMKANPDAIIITADDDLLYNFDIIERLFNSYLLNPHKIHALRTHTLKFDTNGKLLPYDQWGFEKADTDNPHRLFATGCGGVLYPPHSLAPEVFDQTTFTSICPTADDVWFHAMAVLNGTDVIKVPTKSKNGCEYILNEDVQDMGLCQINTGTSGRNDEQIKAVYSKYGIYDLLK